jgi:hypothetical protein
LTLNSKDTVTLHGNDTRALTFQNFFQGSFLFGKKHGEGLHLWNDGARYEGEYCNDARHGYGLFTWPDKKQYQGEWANNQLRYPYVSRSLLRLEGLLLGLF